MKKKHQIVLAAAAAILVICLAVSAYAETITPIPVLKLKTNRMGSVQCVGQVDEIILDTHETGVDVTCRVWIQDDK